MTYELAKKLKDAGFPQWGRDIWENIDGGCSNEHPNLGFDLTEKEAKEHYTIWVYHPSLSELIEACGKGEDFQLHEVWDGDKVSYTYRATNSKVASWFGASTPEEAVAKLWLALHTLTSPANNS